MIKLTYLFGVLLCLLSLVHFLATGAGDSGPVSIGLMLAATSRLFVHDKHRKNAAYAAVFAGAVGLGYGVPGLIKMIQWGLGNEPELSSRAVTQSIAAGLCAIFLVLCIRCFITAWVLVGNHSFRVESVRPADADPAGNTSPVADFQKGA